MDSVCHRGSYETQLKQLFLMGKWENLKGIMSIRAIFLSIFHAIPRSMVGLLGGLEIGQGSIWVLLLGLMVKLCLGSIPSI